MARIQPLRNLDFDTFIKALNNQFTLTGATAEHIESNVSFLIWGLYGTSITVNDANGNTILSGVSNITFPAYFPLRLDGGFSITGTNLNVLYAAV